MDHFHYHNGHYHAEQVPLIEIAKQFGTPCYVYSKATLQHHYQVFEHALAGHAHKICYAVKANSNLAVLQVLAQMGAGFDIVSVGELERVLAAGGRADRVVFSGVGKLVHELERALEVGIYCFNVESKPELDRLNQVAGRMERVAPVAIRVNPDVDAKTHPYIATGLKENKFGIPIEDAMSLYEYAGSLPHLRVEGVDCHIGSQLTELAPLIAAFDKVHDLVVSLREHGLDIKHLDLGGGLGVRYQHETPPHPGDYARVLNERFSDPSLELILEPGRAIAANAGVLLTRVEYIKPTPDKTFAIVDAAMNDLLRPALYSAYHDILPMIPRQQGEVGMVDVVGPVCETGDFLGKDRELIVAAGDYLVVRSAGAYGFGMSSNYNSRPRVAEVMVDGDQAHLIRRRESIEDLFAHEQLLERP